MLLTVLMAALGGAVAGGLWGFAVAVLVLRLRHARNARLAAPIRDCVRPPFHLPGATGGLLLAAGTSFVLPLAWAIALGATLVPLLLLMVSAIAIATQLRNDSATDQQSDQD